MSDRVFGHIEGIKIGQVFANRRELSESGVHRPPMAGISGSQQEGADSIVLSGGYEDDEDHGDVIIYTGQGGNDAQTGEQIGDQTYTRGNLALAISQKEGHPIRVSRGTHPVSEFAPSSGFRYDGLYRVVEHWSERGKSGFIVWRYRLERISDSTVPPYSEVVAPPTGQISPSRRAGQATRIVRSSKVVAWVKNLYDNKCQICGLQIVTPTGDYSETAHIRPLGTPHGGEDTTRNVLCLCPNHHVMFDYHAFTIEDDFSLIGEVDADQIMVKQEHDIDPANLQYHRTQYIRKHNAL